MKGFSYRNIRFIKQWYTFYGEDKAIWQQVVAKLGERFFAVPWGHHQYIINRCKTINKAIFYLNSVIEVKTTEFSPAYIGQIGTYTVAVDHILRREGDNKTIGLLICKTKDNVIAKYALESSNQPIGISEFELSKLFPEHVEGTIPSIEEIEYKLKDLK